MNRSAFFRNTKLQRFVFPIVAILLAMWLVRFVDLVLPTDLNRWGLEPRSVGGLVGIVAMPFLHANFGHLIANTIPLAILLGLTAASRERAWLVVIWIAIGNGVLLWLFGRNAMHVGASGLVFGLIAYLITVGLREKEIASIATALVVGMLFGATLVSGVIPSFGSTVSWDGHLTGAIAGILVAIGTSERRAIFDT